MVKVGIIQMKYTESKEKTLEIALEKIKELSSKGAEIIVLPEIFNAPYDTKKFKEYSEPKNGPTYKALSDIAKENKIILIAGSIPELFEEKVYNTSFIFNEEGNEIGMHRKMHLFDINVKGGQKFKESDSLTAGNTVCVFDTKFCKIGVCICFDMRFPELSRLMVQKGAKMIIVPAAFNMTTGPAHWELLFRQRAVDNQCFTIGCAPARDEKASYISYGNSIVIDPWGTVIFRADKEECTQIVDIDLEKVDSIREQLPLLSARRLDVYRVLEFDKKDEKIQVANVLDAYQIYYVISKSGIKIDNLDIKEIKDCCEKGKYIVYKIGDEIVGCLLKNEGTVFLLPEYNNENSKSKLLENK